MIETLNLSTLFHEQQFDLIITGEGKLDEQTAYGKVVLGITKLSKQYKVPIIAIAGTVEGDITPLHELGLTAAFR
ncbi:UNVERIFIED_CONTAM: glycerate kinase [Bacillus sp. ATCC 13368]